MRQIKPSLLYSEINANAKADIPTMIWGGPGLGKSQIVYQTAANNNSKLFELRANLFDPVDVRGGLKVVEQQDGSFRTRYGIPEHYPDANYQGRVTLFIDEYIPFGIIYWLITTSSTTLIINEKRST